MWYEQARDKGLPFEHYDCNTAQYSLQTGGLLVHNTEYNPSTGKVEGTYANATCNGAQCSVKFVEYVPAGDYRVLSTDYESYAIVYSCKDVEVAKTHFAWLLTR